MVHAPGVLKWLATAALFGTLWIFLDVPAVFARLGEAKLGWVLLGLTIIQLQVGLSAERWRLTSLRLGQDIPRRVAAREYYLATLLNQTLPGGVAGDAARIVRTGREHTLVVASQSVIIERLAGQLVLAAFLAVGLAFWLLSSGGPIPSVVLSGVVGVTGFLTLLAGIVILSHRLATIQIDNSRLAAAVRAARGIAPMLRRCWLDDRAWLPQAVLSIGITSSYIAVYVIAAQATGEPLPSVALISVVPLALFSMSLPIGFGGWGIREAAAAALWPLVGLSTTGGVATSVVYGLISLVGCLPALFVLAGKSTKASRDACRDVTST